MANESNALEDSITDLIEQSGFEIVAKEQVFGRQPILRPIPSRLHPRVQELLSSRYPSGLYAHQSKALDALLDGEDVCVSTATASGKSLIFLAMAAHLLSVDRGARVLALYPQRALIQDQLEKWKEVSTALGLSYAYVDGGVPTEQRAPAMAAAQVLLMTPDACHAWLMSHLQLPEVASFLARLRLVVLDEAHVYEGVFGTNMAYLLRRLDVVSARHQLVCSTATLGRPSNFMEQLTGRVPMSFTAEDDGSKLPEKLVLLVRNVSGKGFEATVGFLKACAQRADRRFLAFGDSRRMVEQLVAAINRQPDDDHEEDGPSGTRAAEEREGLPKVLPYRAGYETHDRQAIQEALAGGQLTGVVSTSALELGLDIGEIQLVLLLTTPPSTKAFWQRLGRAGRQQPAMCVLIDSLGKLARSSAGLREYMARPLDPSWLYLENRYLQYANALCAAVELSQLGLSHVDRSEFGSLPAPFRLFLENELNPVEVVPPDLYPLKQRAQAGPHLEFPLRTGIEPSFQIQWRPTPLGEVTFTQLLREAYPGAIYYYMARPYRVYRLNYHRREIEARPEKRWSTRPVVQAKVFPRFQGGVLALVMSDEGFIAEAEMQVSEKVLGFVEQRGASKEENLYGPKSSYYQRPLQRFFETTGVCWCATDRRATTEAVAAAIQEAFCSEFGVQERDLGVAGFFSKQSPVSLERSEGICVFDAIEGSLRLTQRLAENFLDVVRTAVDLASARDDESVVSSLRALERFATEAKSVSLSPLGGPIAAEKDWVVVIAPGEHGVFINEDGSAVEVTVIAHVYTPQGLKYELVHPNPKVLWRVGAQAVQPLHGATRMIRVNLSTGEIEDI